MKAKKLILLLLVCALAFLIIAGAADAKRMDLKATVTGHVTYIPDVFFGQTSEFGLWTVSDSVGTAGPLGRITMHAYHETPIGHPSYWTGGIMTLTLSDGSRLDCVYSGAAAGDVVFGDHPVLIKGPGEFTITGGSGRFAGASGAGYMFMHLHYPGVLGGPDPWKGVWFITASIDY